MEQKEFEKMLYKKFVTSDVKIKLLKEINYKNNTLCQLAKNLRISEPLASYHINGNEKGNGLMQMGLIEKKVNKRNTGFVLVITEHGKKVLENLEEN